MTIGHKLRFEVLKRDSHACVYCGAQAGPKVTLELDHRVPQCDGGEDTLENLVTACRKCNQGKGRDPAGTPIELRRFSHSLVDTYLDCPRKAMYRYVENIPSPKSAALVKGSATDEAWNLALARKIAGEAPATDDIVGQTEQAFRRVVADEGGLSSIDWADADRKKAARAALNSAMTLSRVWATQLLPDIEPTAVQVELTRELPSGRKFIGFLDYEGLVEGLPAIGDNKTGSRRMAKGDADKGLQPSAYAWLKDEPISFVFSRAIDTGSNTYSEFVWTGRSEADNQWYASLVEQVERGFVAGIFPPNPRSNLCGPKWCPYFERCQPHRTTHTT